MSTKTEHSRAPTVSVVVPAYNAEETIDACIRSLLQLKKPAGEIEIIVVDNNSTDRTPQRIKEYAPAIRILHEPIRGASAARNCGVAQARGVILAFIDADCVADSRWLTNLIRPLADRYVGATGGRILAREPCNWIEKSGEVRHDHRYAIEVAIPPYLIGMNFATRASILQEVGLFDLDLFRGQDVDLGWRIHWAGYEIRYCPDAEIHHSDESTVRGLFLDGVNHGRAQALLGTKYSEQQLSIVRQMLRSGKKITRSAIGCVLSRSRAMSFCDLVYTSGNLYGELKWRRSINRARALNRRAESSSK
jgi:mycofactocin glycosyltransferase